VLIIARDPSAPARALVTPRGKIQAGRTTF
jgi:hypothetical protein